MHQGEGGGAPVSVKIVRNTAYNTLGRIWGMLVSLVLVPFIIESIGVERYGIWALAGVITSYCALADLGFGTSFVKFIAGAAAAGDYRKIGSIVRTGHLFYFFLALCLLPAAVFGVGPLVRLLRIPAVLSSEASQVILLGVMAFALSMLASVPGAVYVGLQRMDISNIVGIAASFFHVIGTVYVISSGYGLRGLMLVAIAGTLLVWCVNWVVAVRLVPAAYFRQGAFDRGLLSEQLRYGLQLQVSRIANAVSFQADRLIISFFLGVGAVAFYQLGATFLQQVRQVPLLLVSALVPAVSELDQQDKDRHIRELYLRGSRYLIGIAVPLTVFIVAAAPEIIFIWMGLGFSLSVSVIRILALGYCCATVTGVASSIAAGTGRTDIDMRFGLVMAFLNIVVSIFLVRLIGFTGVVLGTSFALTAASCFFVRIFHRELIKIPIRDFARLFIIPCIAALCASVVYGVFDVLFPRDLPAGRVVLLWLLAAKAVLFFSTSGAVMMVRGYFDEYDRMLVRKGMRSIFNHGS